tara:strand:+ start:3986 stop:5110 length:1125 start_codon:yes stop_codon:yes gene_type:complete
MNILNPTIKYLNKLQIKYVLSGPALYGLVHNNNINQYSKNLTILLFSHKWSKMIILFFLLLRKGIILKIKRNFNKNLNRKITTYKIVGKPSLFKKTSHHIRIHFLTKEKEQLKIWVGGREIYYNIKDLNDDKRELINYKDMQIYIPQKSKYFTDKYKENLFANYNKKYEVNFKSKNVDMAKYLLEGVVTIIEQQKCNYFLDAGTLLGAIRDKQFIPWDHDVDLGLIYNNQKEVDKLIKALKKKFYIRALQFKDDPEIWKPGKYRIIKAYRKKGLFKREKLCLDIFIFYQSKLDNTGEEVYKYGVWGRNAFYPKHILEAFETTKFYNREYVIPKNPTKFLEFKYGANWKTPIKQWSTILNDTSLAVNNFGDEKNK